MTDIIFIALFTGLSIISALVVEGIKKILDGYKITYNTQTISLICSFIVGIIGTIIYYIFYAIAFSAINIFFIIIMAIAVCIGAQVGYDKVVSTIKEAISSILTKK